MARAVSWRRVNEGYVARAKSNYYYNNKSKLDVSFYVKQGIAGAGIKKYPKLMMVGLKNDKINRKDVLLSIYCNSSYQAKDIVDHMLILAWLIEKNGVPAESVIEWIKMQMQMVDTKLASEPIEPNSHFARYNSIF